MVLITIDSLLLFFFIRRCDLNGFKCFPIEYKSELERIIKS